MKNFTYTMKPAEVSSTTVVATAYDTTALGFMTIDGTQVNAAHKRQDPAGDQYTRPRLKPYWQAPDNLAHKLTFDQPSGASANLGDADVRIVGLDCNLNPQTEASLTMPTDGTAVLSTKFFRVVYSIECIVVDATAGTIEVGTTEAVRSPWILMPRIVTAPYLSWDETGTFSWSLHNTNEDILRCFLKEGTPGAYDTTIRKSGFDNQLIRADESELLVVVDDTISADTADIEAALSDWPCTAVRISATEHTTLGTLSVNFNFVADKYGY